MSTESVYSRHMRNIAKQTLRMSRLGAEVMGAMSHEEAYRIVFKSCFLTRLRELADEYESDRRGNVNWELDDYGWGLQEAIDTFLDRKE